MRYLSKLADYDFTFEYVILIHIHILINSDLRHIDIFVVNHAVYVHLSTGIIVALPLYFTVYLITSFVYK